MFKVRWDVCRRHYCKFINKFAAKKFWKSIIIWKSYGQELQLFDIWPILYIVPHQYHDGQTDRTLIK